MWGREDKAGPTGSNIGPFDPYLTPNVLNRAIFVFRGGMTPLELFRSILPENDSKRLGNGLNTAIFLVRG